MRILSLQTQYGERATIHELVCPALSPTSRASPYDDHIVTVYKDIYYYYFFISHFFCWLFFSFILLVIFNLLFWFILFLLLYFLLLIFFLGLLLFVY